MACEAYAIDFDDWWFGGLNNGVQETWPEGFVYPCLSRIWWHRWLVHLGYLPFGDVWDCPSAPADYSDSHIRFRGGGYNTGSQSYGINYWLFAPTQRHPRSRIEKPSLVWHVSDSESSWLTDQHNQTVRIYASLQIFTGQISQGHEGGSNILFCDGHVEWMKQETIYPLNISGPLKNDQYWGEYNSGY